MSDPSSFYFFKPVEPEQDGAPEYFNYITSPMCFYVIQEKLSNKQYEIPEEFIADVQLIWHNAKYYNGETNHVYQAAEKLRKQFEQLSLTLPRTILPDEKTSTLQLYTELRLKRYRQNKITHL
ncbi:Bromodomain containing protein [Trichomonas vaginalis G3]|uniref:Bromodomain containing protein n=1 Tax=Trichomonas vaginalis (strain ATCC PRA-98 / G3) TaxID=412133 RepID=A2DPU2_TRIV3|nr:histone acetyltransferase protein [Trichomonas vaginalis G3]EAY17538.1 Bromodomain containing protein [Trichomonas vaginalis G3]KAI5520582.1 histone acetyltransferase protein [Trichomonas vaginalis G3]|eukprot:XP_001329673.1 Bromodomain containing protein [Trichomonas vaginalis G3]